MNKLALTFALLLGLGLGLLWPLGQNDQPQATEEATVNRHPLIEMLADQQPAVNKTTDRPNPQPEPDPKPAPAAAANRPPEQPRPDPAPSPAPQTTTKPKIRVVKGQTPEEVIQSFRRSQPLERSITSQDLPPVIDKPPATPPQHPATNITTPKSPTPKNAKAQPVNGNYCYLAYGYQGWPADVAFAVCMAESNGQPGAINSKDKHGSCRGSYGLFQIGCIHADPNDMLDPQQNIDKAYGLYQSQGWQPWSAYNNGSYRRYLPASP